MSTEKCFRCLTVAALVACSCRGPDLSVDTTGETVTIPEVKESFFTVWNHSDNVDSPAVWHDSGGKNWLIATAKSSDVVIVYDAATGGELSRIGGTGNGPGRFKRPNGVAVIDDLALVVERDNHRVQVFGLPEFEHLGFIGERELKRPYGLFIYSDKPGSYHLYVTDDYETKDGETPAENKLGERVKQFDMTFSTDSIRSRLIRSFGETSGPGVLHVVESVQGDPENDRLLIADEDDGCLDIKVYTLDGRFKGRCIGSGIFEYQPEGIALYRCPDGSGWWITTDQGKKRSRFHLFDRKSLEYEASFAGRVTANTDGIGLTQAGFGCFSKGVLYAVHDDGSVAAFSLKKVAQALGLCLNCRQSRYTGCRRKPDSTSE